MIKEIRKSTCGHVESHISKNMLCDNWQLMSGIYYNTLSHQSSVNLKLTDKRWQSDCIGICQWQVSQVLLAFEHKRGCLVPIWFPAMSILRLSWVACDASKKKMQHVNWRSFCLLWLRPQWSNIMCHVFCLSLALCTNSKEAVKDQSV